MSNIKFELNGEGVAEILKCEEIKGLCTEYAQQVANHAGEGFVTEDHIYKKRAGATVKSDNPKSYYKNLKHNTLLKALGQVK